MSMYTAPGSIAVAVTKTPLILGGSTTVRLRLCYFNLSTTGTPTSDQGIEVQVRLATALGTSTAVTPKPTDFANPAATATAGSNPTIEPTYSTGSCYDLAFNPRATVQWAAYDPRAELVTQAASAAGIGFQIPTAGSTGGAAGNLLANANWYE